MSTPLRPHLNELTPLEPQNLGYGVRFPSALGREHGAPESPLVIFGHDALDAASFFAHVSTLNALAVRTVGHLERALANHTDALGIFAMSPPDRPGDAAAAIDLFRAAMPSRRLVLYGAWTFDVGQACQHALACGADGVIMPDCDVQELFAFIFTLLQGIDAGEPVPATVAEHQARLKLGFTQSTFWFQRDEAPPTSY